MFIQGFVRRLNRYLVRMRFGTRGCRSSLFFVVFFLGMCGLFFLRFMSSHHENVELSMHPVSPKLPKIMKNVALKHTHKIPVQIVEEHHEVLPYWFQAVSDGHLPKGGNVLLHIDGHGDDAPPEFLPGHNVYRWPRGGADVHKMMQSNDLFIVSAALVGMFKRAIWVWPKWDQKNHKKNWETFNIQFGERIIVGKADNVEKIFCLCEKQANKVKKCYAANHTLAETTADKEKFRIPSRLCQLNDRKMIWEEIREDQAEEKIKSGIWIQPNEPLMVDIDEDYFGCESGAKYLTAASVKWKDIELLDVAISQLICPMLTIQEAYADRLFMQITREAIKRCEPSNKHCTDIYDDILLFTKQKFKLIGDKNFLCTKNAGELEERVTQFVDRLLTLSLHQLKALINTGFCMQTTPKSYHFSGIFQVCHGFNVPGNSVVLYHSPTKPEVKKRLELLKSMLAKGKLPKPNMVTVCRSIRDGYTPREYFKAIETGITDSLQRKYGEDLVHIKYDKDLLGGKEGWPRNHINVNKK